MVEHSTTEGPGVVQESVRNSWEAQTCMGRAYTTVNIGHRWGKSRHAVQIEGRKSSPALGFFFSSFLRLDSKKEKVREMEVTEHWHEQTIWGSISATQCLRK